MFFYSGKVTSTLGKEPTVVTTREELKNKSARGEWKKLIEQGWRRTKEDWTKKRARTVNS